MRNPTTEPMEMPMMASRDSDCSLHMRVLESHKPEAHSTWLEHLVPTLYLAMQLFVLPTK
jgi:hypothetical protein